MIFVTVGTHEQQFNRLIQYVDQINLIGLGFQEEIIFQTGYSTYKPKSYHRKLLSYKSMVEYVEKASIVITHGGPSSIMLPLQMGKIPIVVPRQKEFGEHINNHQVEFVKKVEKSLRIIPVYDVNKLKEVIQNYNHIVKDLGNNVLSNNTVFNNQFNDIVFEVMKD